MLGTLAICYDLALIATTFATAIRTIRHYLLFDIRYSQFAIRDCSQFAIRGSMRDTERMIREL